MKEISRARRSLVKGISWESFACILSMLVTYWYLDNLRDSLCLTSILFVIKIILFFAHERIWHQIKWGKIICKE